MAIQDRIAAAQEQINSAQADISEYEGVLQKISDQHNQLQTAALQHGNDQKSIDDLTAKLKIAADEILADEKDIKDLQAEYEADEKAIVDLQGQVGAKIIAIQNLQAQLAQLQSTATYPDLESNPWKSNTDKSVGGSGLGTGGWKAPSVECAELWILDQAGVPAPNYVDCYNTQRVPTDGAKTRFKLEASFLFPTAADVAACQCLEFEERQVTDDKKMVILAGQLQYSGGQFRYFDWEQRAWLSFGVPITRPAPLTWVSVAVEGHRDDTTVYYDAMTYNGTRTPMTQKYSLLATDWSPLLWAALQLDDTSAVNGYRVKIKDVTLTVS